jgi:hypothetical protein
LERRPPHDLIAISEACSIFSDITGKKINGGLLRDKVTEEYPHLGYFVYHDPECISLAGIRRGRWEYFLKSRMALRESAKWEDLLGENTWASPAKITWKRINEWKGKPKRK